MKLALYQGPVIDGATGEAFAKIREVLTAAAAAGTRMALFPELFLPGYNHPEHHAALAQPQGGAWITALSALARETGCGLTIGWAEAADGTVYNAATTIDASGALRGHYRKIQLYGPMERASFTPGGGYCLFDLEGMTCALLICYDVEFAPHLLALSEAGAELVLVPTANPQGFEHVQDFLVPARAAELGLIVAYASFCGEDAGLGFSGRSLIAGPDGRALAAAGPGETLLVTDLDAAALVPAARRSTQLSDLRRISDDA